MNGFAHCRWCSGRGCTACPGEQKTWEANGGTFPPSKLRPPPPPTPIGACYACGAPAHLLCDGPIPHPSGGRLETCDRPMCAEHVAYQARVHVQRAGPGGRGRRCSWETYDLCADCLRRCRAEIDERRKALS